MKHFLLKAALTLGLICMYHANISALPAWGDDFQVAERGSLPMNNARYYWTALKFGNFYLYYDSENETWGTTTALPTSNVAKDWKNYLFASNSYSYTTFFGQLMCANGKYLCIDESGNITVSENTTDLFYDNKTSYTIRNTDQTYCLTIDETGTLSTVAASTESNPTWTCKAYYVRSSNTEGYYFTIGSYKYTISKTATTPSSGEVTVTLANYNVTNAVIESSVENAGYTYNVTTVDAFTDQSINMSSTSYRYEGSCGKKTTKYDIGGYNPNLRTVTFREPCNVTKINDNAFKGCVNLQTFTLPYSVKSIGTRAFQACLSMTSFYFQTQNGKTQITTLPERAFQYCEALKSIELPEGITEIGIRTFQYNIGLTTIKLPNTLETIGNHFLCCANSLTTLTIPASVKKIDGAAFHGCESLRTVYLLGPASTLDAETAVKDGETFGENSNYCSDKVHDCIFYTTMDYIEGYRADTYEDGSKNTWQQLDGDNGKNDLKNYLRAPIPNTRDLQKGKWATICFATLPTSEAGFNAIFGTKGVDSKDGWRVAIMTDAEVDSYEHEGGDPNLYHTYYQTIPFEKIKTNTPYLICPGKDVKDYMAWTATDEADPEFKLNMTADHDVTKTASDGALVCMTGRILGIDQLYPDDIYFKAVDEVGTDKVVGGFYQVKNGIKVKLGPCRAYWHIYQNGVKSETAALGGVKKVNNTENVDAINEIERDVRVVVNGIYDMNGRKLNVTQEQLPKGMYIMDGKKMLVK